MQTFSLVSICVLLGVVIRWGVSLHSYSGRNVSFKETPYMQKVASVSVIEHGQMRLS